MSSARGVVALDRLLWQDLLAALEGALDGSRRALARLAEGADVPHEEALRDLAALPARSCSAREPGATLRVASCSAGAGCPVEDECPLVRGGGRAAIARSGPARLVATLAQRFARPLPAAPFVRLHDFAHAVDRLVERSGRVAADTPPRARTAHTVLDLALRRGGPFGATGPYLSGSELEQVAAFVPPGCGRGDALLLPVEAWLRRTVSAEAAVVDLQP